jgi:hypothetical protein
VSSITEEKEERSIYVETYSKTTSDTSVNVSKQQSENTASSDPALWPSRNKNVRSYWVEKGPSVCRNKQCSFIKSACVYTVGDKHTETRHLAQAMFKRQLSNGEVADCEWLIYSSSQGKVYCFVCKLFLRTDSAFNTSRFNDWKRAFKEALHHENEQEHRKCIMTYYSHLKVSGRADTQLAIQFNNGHQYWKEVLKRI